MPPPGTEDITPFLPAFVSIPPSSTPVESREPPSQLPGPPLQLVVRDRHEEMSKEARQRELAEQLAHLDKVDEDELDTEEEKNRARAFKAKFSAFFRSRADTAHEEEAAALTAEERETEASLLGWPLPCRCGEMFTTNR